jgi:Tfp pilus assembly protein PilW
VDIQQNLRNSLYILQRSIRMAGFDPKLEVRGTTPERLGLLSDFSAFGDPHGSSGAATALNVAGNGSSIAFTVDANGDTIDPGTNLPVAGAGTIEASDTELIAFRLSGSSLQKYRPSAGDWVTVSENIDSLLFEYLDDSGAKLLPPLADFSAVRSVRITIGAKPVRELAVLANDQRQNFLSATVRIRNSSL